MKQFSKMDKILSYANASFMSNAKWRKFVKAIGESGINVYCSSWKMVNSDQVYTENGFPETVDMSEEGFLDGPWGPVYFKYIHWIRIPRFCQNPRSGKKRPLPEVETKIDDLVLHLSTVAEFPITLNEDYLEIKGYEF